MTGRDRQICDRLISVIDIAQQLFGGLSMEDFDSDERTFRAAAMTLINIGELVKNLTAECKAAHPEISRRAISGMWDITAHKYQILRREDVYITCVNDLLLFGEQLRSLIAAEE